MAVRRPNCLLLGVAPNALRGYGQSKNTMTVIRYKQAAVATAPSISPAQYSTAFITFLLSDGPSLARIVYQILLFTDLSVRCM